MRFFVIASGVLAALGASPVAAQQDPAPVADLANESGEELRQERLQQAEEDRIVVTGRVEDASRAEIHRQARDIAVTQDVLEAPLARFESALCPGIIGLTYDAAVSVINRIRDNAAMLEMRLQDYDCQPNFMLVIAEDGQELMSGMLDNNPGLFQFMNPAERRRLREPGPVRVWTDVQQATRDGMRVPRVRNLVNPPSVRMEMAHSHIYTTVRNEIDTVWVVMDRDAVRGLSLLQIADYATMRGLAQTEPQEDMQLSSILGLFNENGPWPEQMTDFDRAYLAALYDYIPNLPAFRKLGRVATELRRIQAAQLDIEGGRAE